jgi:hypothetical protein
MLVPNRIPVDIRPTSFIKKIRFNFKCTHTSADLTKAYLQYFQYIAKKYTNPENLSMNVLDSVDFTMDDKNKVFDFGWTPLLQSFGPQLKSIKSVDVDPQVNIFKRLDDLGCKLEKLSIYPTQGTLTLAEFVQSNQSKYMRELYMSDVALRPGDSLKETKLVKLTLFASVDDDSLVLNHFLKICPDTLKHLRLESYDIEYDESDDFQCFSLISLKINNDSFGEIGNGVTENVHKCCPNLKELRIEDYL